MPNNLGSLECVKTGVQATGPDSAIPGHGEVGCVPKRCANCVRARQVRPNRATVTTIITPACCLIIWRAAARAVMKRDLTRVSSGTRNPSTGKSTANLVPYSLASGPVPRTYSFNRCGRSLQTCFRGPRETASNDSDSRLTAFLLRKRCRESRLKASVWSDSLSFAVRKLRMQQPVECGERWDIPCGSAHGRQQHGAGRHAFR